MKKRLEKPEYWQDFEDLCKKVFGVIWNCSSSIKKNGRLGQEQNGIDVYSFIKSENAYYGIQCKGKDDYKKSKFTFKEIENELTKILEFKPVLRKVIFASTGAKDSKIEEFIRIKNQSGELPFEIDVYFWEDISDLILENEEILSYYNNAKNSNHPMNPPF